jgi:conjugal transfer pilin signal peptidase TrbI
MIQSFWFKRSWPPLFFKTHKKVGIFVILITPLCLSSLLSFGFGYRVVINTTYSLPHTFYLTNPVRNVPQRGDYIAFTHPISTKMIVKQVLGVAGDTLTQTPSFVCVEGSGRILSLKKKRSTGTPLTPMDTDVIPEGMVFVAGTHSDSFDSRYKEFGFVPLETVRGQVWPLF